MYNLPKFNQLAFTYEQFIVADDPFVWPKTFIVPDHRIVLVSNLQFTCTTDLASSDPRIHIYVDAGIFSAWEHWYEPAMILGSTRQINIHPGIPCALPTDPTGDIDFTMPDHLYLYALRGIALGLGDPDPTSDITNLVVNARTWIL
jgi:hypothetical protein